MTTFKKNLSTALTTLLAVVVLYGLVYATVNFSVKPNLDPQARHAVEEPVRDVKANPNYTGTLRIFVTEKVSQVDDYSNTAYDYGFIDFAYDAPLDLPYLDSYTDTITWDGSGVSGLDFANVRMIAACYNPEGERRYSYPDPPNPPTFPYQAYPVDATAAADLAQTWANQSDYPGFTHTVFIEKGTATW